MPCDQTGDDNEDSAQDDVKDEKESEVKVSVHDNMANPKVYDNNHEHNLPNSYVTFCGSNYIRLLGNYGLIVVNLHLDQAPVYVYQ